MKNTFWKTLTFFIIAAAAVTTSCFLTDDDEDDKLAAPNYSSQTKAYSISTVAPEKTITANLFRQSCDSKEFDDEKKISTENIGQVVPLTSEKYLSGSINFTDEYTDTNFFYRYAVRFYDGFNYTWTHYSAATPGLGTTEAILRKFDNEMKFKLKFYRNDKTKEYSLSVENKDDAIVIPEETNKLAIVLDNGKITKPFEVECEEQTSESGKSFKNICISKLQDVLSKDFYIDDSENEIKISPKGLIAYNSNETVFTYYFWTNLFKIPEADVEIEWINSDGTPNEEANSIQIPSPEKTKNPLLFSVMGN